MTARWLLAPLLGMALQVPCAPAGAQSADPAPAPPGAAQPAAPAQPAEPPAAASAAPSTPVLTGEAGQAWFRVEWEAYKGKFLRPEGRIVDNANGDISHSEGQGYGMLLAVLAGDAPAFETIWHWTEQNLMVGPEGLAAWKWDPKRRGVGDPNNAADGDILMAWALAKAARRFERTDYRASAESIAEAIGALLIKPNPRGPILMPALKGFGRPAQPDGPIVNLSYYVFPAFDDLADLAPDHDWEGLRATGLKLIEASRFGPLALPSDWESLKGSAAAPARNFANAFSYDAIRIPLYLAWGSGPDHPAAARFAPLWDEAAGTVKERPDPKAPSKPPLFADAGYRLVAALAHCSSTGRPLPRALIGIRDDLYYPATLRLLAVAAAQEKYRQCL